MTLTAENYYYNQLNKEQKKNAKSMVDLFFLPRQISRFSSASRNAIIQMMILFTQLYILGIWVS